ncbi:L,D-transpeptidase catalytic domain [Sphingomonas laterariae]|uniref:L,D-transpeptidase catalytic domain n=1 Tax=Edaphosphingomonas laterariae TaxID=861865 RepID=A0A239GB62_9SPHN|nr:L,D-transpeptidase [Sphingomonas laterariae]SNS66038.1 L,D-transpeptidase catalytic domain [Sphingomonas laterariae]
MMITSRRGAMLWLGGGIALSAGAAHAMQALNPATIEESVANLKPGQFLWAPDIAPDGPVMVLVSLALQRAYVYRNGVLIGVSTVSTGKKGHETPTGVFTVLQKAKVHHSNLYNNAAMPYMQRLTWDGIAMHAGSLPGYPASHGCIRLPPAFARQLYGVTALGLTVVITENGAVPRVAPTPAMLEAGTGTPPDADADGVRWTPEKSPTGPISIIISASDRRLVVLRNGKEIGRTPVTIAGEVAGTSAYTLRAIEGTTYHWLQLPLPGQTVAPNTELLPEERERLRLPEDFRAQLAGILAPGATVVLTGDSLRSGGAGKKLTVIKSEDEG